MSIPLEASFLVSCDAKSMNQSCEDRRGPPLVAPGESGRLRVLEGEGRLVGAGAPALLSAMKEYWRMIPPAWPSLLSALVSVTLGSTMTAESDCASCAAPRHADEGELRAVEVVVAQRRVAPVARHVPAHLDAPREFLVRVARAVGGLAELPLVVDVEREPVTSATSVPPR
jgi:hypothetical protein